MLILGLAVSEILTVQRCLFGILLKTDLSLDMSFATYIRRSSSPRYMRRSISPRTIPREAAYPPPRRPPTAPSRVDPNPVLGVFGLSIRTREADLEDEFARYGEVAKVVIVYDQRVRFDDLDL